MKTFGKLSENEEFSVVYKTGRKWHYGGIIIFYLKSDEQKMTVVVSKKVGEAVIRNRSRRILRTLFTQFENKLRNGRYIFAAKSEITQFPFSGLEKDLKWGLRKLECLK